MHEGAEGAPAQSARRAQQRPERVQGEVRETGHAARDVNLRDFDGERQKCAAERGEHHRREAVEARRDPEEQAESERQIEQYVRNPIAAAGALPRQLTQRLQNPAVDRLRLEVERVERAVRDQTHDRESSQGMAERLGFMALPRRAVGCSQRRCELHVRLCFCSSLQSTAYGLQPDVVIHQQRGEQQREVSDRKRERLHRQPFIAAHLELQCAKQKRRRRAPERRRDR